LPVLGSLKTWPTGSVPSPAAWPRKPSGNSGSSRYVAEPDGLEHRHIQLLEKLRGRGPIAAAAEHEVLDRNDRRDPVRGLPFQALERFPGRRIARVKRLRGLRDLGSIAFRNDGHERPGGDRRAHDERQQDEQRRLHGDGIPGGGLARRAGVALRTAATSPVSPRTEPRFPSTPRLAKWTTATSWSPGSRLHVPCITFPDGWHPVVSMRTRR
jgi:hypothetical protein